MNKFFHYLILFSTDFRASSVRLWSVGWRIDTVCSSWNRFPCWWHITGEKNSCNFFPPSLAIKHIVILKTFSNFFLFKRHSQKFLQKISYYKSATLEIWQGSGVFESNKFWKFNWKRSELQIFKAYEAKYSNDGQDSLWKNMFCQSSRFQGTNTDQIYLFLVRTSTKLANSQ